MVTPFLALVPSMLQPPETFVGVVFTELSSRTFLDAFLWDPPRKKSTFLHLHLKQAQLKSSSLATRVMHNLQVCACLSRAEGGWVINVYKCINAPQTPLCGVSGKDKNRTFYILQVTSYFSQPGVRNLILSKLGNLCFLPDGILAVINPSLRCVFPEEGVCNQQD